MNARSVLVAEDEALVAMELRDRLRELGFGRIDVVGSGEEAIRQAERARPDVALLDIRLRGGSLDGIAVGETLSLRLDIPVIFITAHSDAATLARATHAVPYGYLLKPIDAASLRTTLETALVRHDQHRASRRAATSAEAREREIRGLAHRLEFLLASSPVITYTAAPSAGFQTRYISPNVERILGWRSADAVGDPTFFERNVHPEDWERVIASLSQLSPAFPVQVEYRVRCRSGEFRTFLDHVNLIAGDETGPEVIGFLLDVTERSNAEKQLRETERLAAVGAMVSGLAHEVRNPLFAISASLDAFTERISSVPDLEQFVSCLEGGVRRLRDLMGQLLILADPIGLDPQFVEVRHIIDHAIIRGRAPASSRDIKVVLSVEAGLKVKADPDRVIHAFRRVIDNAVEHSPPGSRVVITAAAHGSLAQCVIRDSGSGFAPEDATYVFDPFFTRRSGSTGLGLSIARRIIEALGGSIDIGTECGPGGRVRISIPLAETGAPAWDRHRGT